MSQIKAHEMKLRLMIEEGSALIEDFKKCYKMMEDMRNNLPSAMKTERKEATDLMAELAAHSRDMKAAVKEANIASAHISGHYAWKQAVMACFGEDGLKQCYEYFAEHREGVV